MRFKLGQAAEFRMMRYAFLFGLYPRERPCNQESGAQKQAAPDRKPSRLQQKS
jgi:hypothetical protein